MSIKILQEMSAAHLENVKRKIAELKSQKQILEEELTKLISYYDYNSRELENSLQSSVE